MCSRKWTFFLLKIYSHRFCVASCLQNILGEGKLPSATMLTELIMTKNLPDIRWTFSSRSDSLSSSRQPSAPLLCFPEKGSRRPARIESWTRKWHPKRPPSKDPIECGSRTMKLVRQLDERCFWIVALIRKVWWKSMRVQDLFGYRHKRIVARYISGVEFYFKNLD